MKQYLFNAKVKNTICHRKLLEDSTNVVEPSAKKLAFPKKNEGDSQIVYQITASPYTPYLASMHPSYFYSPYSLTYPFLPTPQPMPYQPYLFLSTSLHPSLLLVSRPINVVNQTFPLATPIDLRKKRRTLDPLPIPYTKVFHSLIEQKLIVLELPPQVPIPPPK